MLKIKDIVSLNSDILKFIDTFCVEMLDISQK